MVIWGVCIAIGFWIGRKITDRIDVAIGNHLHGREAYEKAAQEILPGKDV